MTLVTTHGSDDDPRGLANALPRCDVVSVLHAAPKRETARFAAALLRSWLSRLPVDLWRWRVPELQAETLRRLSTGDVDVCVADFLAAVPNIPNWPNWPNWPNGPNGPNGPSLFDRPPKARAPVVLFQHNVEHAIWRRLAAVERRPWRRALLEIEWRKMRRFEAKACAAARLTLAVSEEDRAALMALAPRALVRSTPTGVDADYFQPNGNRERAKTLVFTGSLDWYPNEDAVLYFIETILPRIRREVPEAVLSVVGRSPSARLRAAAEAAGASVAATVADVRPYVDEAVLYVVPLRVGGGTRLKIFEALAMGKAVVSTSVGAEGLPIVPDEHFVLADDPEEFAGAVVSLMRDPVRRAALGEAGRRLVGERHSWTQVAGEFEAMLKEVAK